MGIRLHLCGRVWITGETTIDERELPGRQGRVVLSLLAVERRHPVEADRLVRAVWDDEPPPDANGALASIVSKVRSALRRAADAGPDVITTGAGTYQLRLPEGSTVDLEDARRSIDHAEGARRRGDVAATWAEATVAVSIARRRFLAGESAPWVRSVQRELDRIAGRGYECLTWVWTERDDGALATAMAERAVELEPLHEPAWRRLMRTHARFASRADAVRAYRRCRDVLGAELGVDPDAATTRLYEQLLTS